MVQLSDKYKLVDGDVLITGVQALARALLEQAALDSAAGLKTAGFVSGYRGSPLGGLDSTLWAIKDELTQAAVHFEPGVNEELAVTAVWGTQQLAIAPKPRVQGVYAMWYGKGPGVDRAGDAIRHGNTSGSARHGGVLLVFGDDHAGKSSTLAHHSEHTLSSFSTPILYPATVQEVLDYSLYGWALSRYSGCWVALKMVNETAEKTAVIRVAAARHGFSIPIGATPGDLHFGPQDYNVVGDDIRLQRQRLPSVHTFARANPPDRCVVGDANAELGIITAGKTYLDVLEALKLLGIDSECARDIGLAVYKVGLIFPLEPTRLTAFALRKKELLFVEEKKPFIEPQAASILFNLAANERPRITGKHGDAGEMQFPSDVQLTPEQIAEVIVQRLREIGRLNDRLAQKAISLNQLKILHRPRAGALPRRIPYFCAGCPHNTSTRVPDGSVAFSGIGCHGMAAWMDRNTVLPTQMGSEGMNWVGMARFSETPHAFQNMGDGTFYHSGLLAIRGAISANATITFKILVNDAVAMTGGQPVEGKLGVKGIVASLQAEGVRRIAVVTVANLSEYRRLQRNAGNVTLHRRESLAAVQAEMRQTPGVTAIVYEQVCAAELRRRRKRGAAPDPDQRVFINPAVCEGCGDCTKQSNCVAIVPIDTDWGRKRAIDQSTCNKDFSCLQAFCPAMVTVHGASARTKNTTAVSHQLNNLPPPAPPCEAANILLTGIGGTGVITVGAVLCMAAHLEGKGATSFDMTGLAQKGGAVYSHIRVTPEVSEENASKIGQAATDLIIGGDLVASVHEDVIATIGTSSRCILNTQYVPTAAFQLDNDVEFHEKETVKQLESQFAPTHFAAFNAAAAALSLIGDTLQSNMLLLGFALQKGWLPVGEKALKDAIGMNGQSVSRNLSAIDLGRLAAADPQAFQALLPAHDRQAPEETLSGLIQRRISFLTNYQNAAYAAEFVRRVDEVREVESKTCPGSERLCGAVARSLSQLMSYKDEYEVARLYTSESFRQLLDSTFDEGYSFQYHLSPPFLAGLDKETNRPKKLRFGEWLTPLFRLLARLRFLRGTPLDPFGYSTERRMERQLIKNLTETVRALLDQLNPSTLEQTVEIVERYQTIRGFGVVKQRNAERVLAEVEERKRTLGMAITK